MMTEELPDGARVSLIQMVMHMAIVMGWYAAGAAAICLALLGASLSVLTMAIVSLTTVSIYLIDRAGWRSGAQDPADRLGDPSRALFMADHGDHVRLLAWIMLTATVVMSAVVTWWLPLCVAAAPAALAIYLRGPIGGRLKDRLLIKNTIVGGAIIGFIVVVSIISIDPLPSWKTIGIVALAMFLQVVADCVLCDIDDVEGDRQSGTRTIANTWSVGATWAVSATLIAASSIVVAVGVAATLLPATPSIIASLAMAATWILLWLFHPRQVRHAVDTRLGVSGAVTWIVLGLL